MLNEYNPNFVEVASDDQGMMATDLEKQLANWPADRRKPKLIYTIPTGSNPAGTCASKERKIELLKIAKKYDIMLAEDDAYYYLVSGCLPTRLQLESALLTAAPALGSTMAISHRHPVYWLSKNKSQARPDAWFASTRLAR